MYLQRLELHGFKSFANATTLAFSGNHKRPGTTAVVGPNGSGKSNIADAIRWVLGEQSMKMIRGKKSEDVIFSGSEKKARLGMAEVSLTLNNEDRQAPIDFSEVTITRRLYRDGTSEYLINKSPVRLYDIQLLLAKSNFGQRTYSVIGQGMVDEILMVSPRERKEFFDEAAGVKQFLIKKEQSEQKLGLARENLKQAALLIQEIEPQLRSLTRQVKRLERREEVEKELRGLQNEYYGTLYNESTKELKSRETHIAGFEAKRKKKEGEVAEIQKKLTALEKQETRGEAFLAAQRAYETLVKKRNTLRDEEFALKQELLKAERATVETALAIPPQELLAALNAVLKDYDAAMMTISNAKSIDAFTDIQPQLTSIRTALTALVKRVTPKSNVPEGKDVGSLKTKLEILAHALTTVAEGIARAEEDLKKLATQEKEEKSAFFALQRQFQTEQATLNTLVQEENNAKIDRARLDQKKEDLEREIKNEGLTIPLLLAGEGGVRSAGDVVQILPEIQKLKHQLELIGGTDPEAVAEYHKVKERHDFLTTQSEDLTKAIAQLETAIEELDATIKTQFDTAFERINEEFQKFFRTLFRGGTAKLVLVKEIPQEESPLLAGEGGPALRSLGEGGGEVSDEKESSTLKAQRSKPIVAGIDIHATPPGKRLKGIGMLSGGERALTSIALICAFISNNPA
ncbi:AAA family ATPase, partial [Candidatus Uhrbacteria bacterium]|nr:AAA family ATPase [Candidatus Uhrbacteria bacterium]